jgi:hypothetical protein
MPDIVERFQLGHMLFAIWLRNLIELSVSTESMGASGNGTVLPKAFYSFLNWIPVPMWRGAVGGGGLAWMTLSVSDITPYCVPKSHDLG